MKKTTPLTITSQIAESLGLPSSHEADALLTVRYKAVSEVVSSFLNYTEKNEISQKGFFSAMIIRILRPNDNAVNFSDMELVIRTIEKGDKAILQEKKQEREEWLAKRKIETQAPSK
jgi:hypothetical protein